MSKSTSDTGLLKSLSLGRDLTNNLSFETGVAVINLSDWVKHSLFVKRSILDDSAQWFEHVLAALEYACNNSRTLNSLCQAFWTICLIITDHANFVRIIGERPELQRIGRNVIG